MEEYILKDWKMLITVIVGILLALLIVGIFGIQVIHEKGKGIKIKSRDKIDKKMLLSWFISKQFSRYRNNTVFEWYREIEILILSGVKMSFKNVEAQYKSIIFLQAKLNCYDYWRKFSNAIIDNHFSFDEKELNTQINNLVNDIKTSILFPISSEYTHLDIEFHEAEIYKKLESIIIRNRKEKETMAEEFFKELGHKPTINEITELLRILA